LDAEEADLPMEGGGGEDGEHESGGAPARLHGGVERHLHRPPKRKQRRA
jgi:hypothetical protein